MSHRLRFEAFEIDVEALELRLCGDPLPLAPAAVRVLCMLADKAGELVSREEIYGEIWPEGGVDRERLLNTYIRQIRAALGERSGDDRFIRTYPRRGYRFLPDVIRGDPLHRPPTDPEDRARIVGETTRSGGPFLAAGRRAVVIGIVALVAGLATATALFRPGPDSDDTLSPPPASVATEFWTASELLADPMPATRARAAEHYQRVVAREPSFAPGYTGLAQSLIWAGRVSEAMDAARHAIALGTREARAYMSLGTARLVADWSWEEAEKALRRAVVLDSSDPAPHLSLAFLLVNSGRGGEARQHLDHARRLSPVSADIIGDLGTLYGWLGDYGLALELCRRTTLIEPRATWGYACALQAGRALGRTDVVAEASAALARAAGGDPAEVFSDDAGIAERIIELQRFRRAGPEFERLSHYGRSLILAELGLRDEALGQLERSAEKRELGFVTLLGEPRFRPLHDHGRFERLATLLFRGGIP